MANSVTRRTVLRGAAAATATGALAAPFVHGAYAAGNLSVGFWDHWVPGANDTLTKLCKEWAEKEKVEIKIDYITSQGDKLNLTQAAEAQARSGHDMLTFLAWVDAVLRAHVAAMVDKDGTITVKSDAMKQVLEWFKKLVPNLPKDAFAWDDSSNNKFLISGEAALIFNPPSAWAVAVRDAPKVAEQVWHFPPPKGPKGHFEAAVPFFWGTWKFSPNKSAAKSLLTFLCQRSSVEQTVAASHGYDIPPFEGLHDFKTWEEEGPPKGTVYHYPPRGDVEMVIPYSPAPAGIANQIYAQATVPKMIAKCAVDGQSVDQAIAWAASELE